VALPSYTKATLVEIQPDGVTVKVSSYSPRLPRSSSHFALTDNISASQHPMSLLLIAAAGTRVWIEDCATPNNASCSRSAVGVLGSRSHL
jgi:hypothetical protein